MAISRVCSIPDCDKGGSLRLGLCCAHYTRWRRHGDPLKGSTSPGAAREYIEEVVLPYNGDDCLAWPYAHDQNGRGKISVDGVLMIASRYVCLRTKGEPPTSDHQAAHSCGNGHLGCVNPRHLEWKTSRENHADKIIHGTANRGERNPFAKLTERQVQEIRLLLGHHTQVEIAKMFNVSPNMITRISTRRNWAHV